MLIEARESEYHQDRSNCRLRLICGSIKSLTNGTRLQCDLGEPMASVMAIEREVLISCVEGIRIDLGRIGIGDCFGVC